jgi:hypothetical protein
VKKNEKEFTKSESSMHETDEQQSVDLVFIEGQGWKEEESE